MVLTCSAAFCKSTQNTLINGEKVHFFSFPTDEKLREQWNKVCITTAKSVKYSGTRVICHLHFNKSCFETISKLKPDAIPTVHCRKKKAEASLESNNIPMKRSVINLPEVNNEIKMNSEDNSIQSDSSIQTKLQPYRLIVEIEKFFQQPCPKSKKNNRNKINTTVQNILMNHLSNKEHIVLKDENQNHLCLVCKETFETASELYTHLKEHFTCDICGIEFLSQMSYKSHYEMHQSKNERYPYKCHVCNALFEKKEYIKTHNHIKNMQKFDIVGENRIQYCKSCHMTFRDEPTFRKHLNSHVEEATLNNLNEPSRL
ncbi:zinc finger protein 860-like [Phymastichus coffea]|uniref:zinc finger protein 860-like n=1 Tax=Phymastichus coffea TaxID=108790 RepID=UPI00273AA6B0|nr:zinc finger protein 860-like [Phymastichus coffea]